MSLFKKPKKPVQLRLFTSEVDSMEVDENEKADEEAKPKKKDKKEKEKDKSSKPSKSSLLSFGDEGIRFASGLRLPDDITSSSNRINKYTINPLRHGRHFFFSTQTQLFLEDEGETFQVKKSSFSRRIHKERKKNKSNDKSDKPISKNSQNSISHHDNNSKSSPTPVRKDNFVKEIQSDDGFSVRLLLFNFTFPHFHLFSLLNLKKTHYQKTQIRILTSFPSLAQETLPYRLCSC